MAYFSNGLEGMNYEAVYCDRCVHHEHRDDSTFKGCPLMDVQMDHNHDQIGKGKTAKTIKSILDALIPMDGQYAGECAMFHPKDEERRDYLKELQEGKPTFGEWWG